MYLCALFHSPKSKIQTHRLYECQCSKALKRSDNFWFYKNDWNLEKYGFVSPDDSIHNSTNLLILHTGYQISQFLTSFRGSYAVFLNAETQDSCARKFLERWITQSFDMMSSIIVYQKPGLKLDEKAVLEGLNIEKPHDLGKYPYGSMWVNFQNFPDKVNNSQVPDCNANTSSRQIHLIAPVESTSEDRQMEGEPQSSWLRIILCFSCGDIDNANNMFLDIFICFLLSFVSHYYFLSKNEWCMNLFTNEQSKQKH